VQALSAVRLRLQQVRPAMDNGGEDHLVAAAVGVDRLIAALSASAADHTHLPALRTRPDGHLAQRRAGALDTNPPDPPAELPRLFAAATALHDRLHRISVALSLSEDAIADILDGIERPEDSHNLEILVARSRATASICRELGTRLDAVHAEPVETAST
jgi:hypothetical protein